ncbi:MAG: 6-hexanolactone hydrolase [Oscillospiraceae bacterium]|nr:6-hexanolactone hydrolase [Oscillospiraceae bacterium]
MEEEQKKIGPFKRPSEQKRTEAMMRALKLIYSVASKNSLNPADLERQRRGHEVLGKLFSPMIGMTWEPFELGGVPAAWTRPSRGHDRRQAVLYCHGGGYTSGNVGFARNLSAKLAQVTGYDVISFGYRLAPEHPYPAALEDAVQVWDHLMYQGYGARDVVVAGDSAGGNLALALTLRLRSMGRKLPRALVLLSPFTDMTASGASYAARAEDDPILSLDYIRAVSAAYAGGHALGEPMLSPLFANLNHFPPTLIQAGSHEILLSDSVRLRDRMVASGVPCRLEVYQNMWHVFQMYPIKRASVAMEHVGKFLLELF